MGDNNNCGCKYDKGDCCAKTVKGGKVITKFCKVCKCLDPKGKAASNCDTNKNKCGAANYKGDGNCHDVNNNCGCDFDGGDCCAKSAKQGTVITKYCKVCKCLDPKYKAPPCLGKCGDAKTKKDGKCDDNNNNCGCEFDGGDCCAKSLKKAVDKTKCTKCLCLDPKNQPICDKSKQKCGAANYKGDGNCDDENNNCGCDFDGGDCCAKSAKQGKVITKYCKQCKCVDPKNQ